MFTLSEMLKYKDGMITTLNYIIDEVRGFIKETAIATIKEELYDKNGKIKPEARSAAIAKLAPETAILHLDESEDAFLKFLNTHVYSIYLFSNLNIEAQKTISSRLTPLVMEIIHKFYILYKGYGRDYVLESVFIVFLFDLIYLNRTIDINGGAIPYYMPSHAVSSLRQSIFELSADFCVTTHENPGDYWPQKAYEKVQQIKREAQPDKSSYFDIRFIKYNDDYIKDKDLIEECIAPLYELLGAPIAQMAYETGNKELCLFFLTLVKSAHEKVLNVFFPHAPRE